MVVPVSSPVLDSLLPVEPVSLLGLLPEEPVVVSAALVLAPVPVPVVEDEPDGSQDEPLAGPELEAGPGPVVSVLAAVPELDPPSDVEAPLVAVPPLESHPPATARSASM